MLCNKKINEYIDGKLKALTQYKVLLLNKSVEN